MKIKYKSYKKCTTNPFFNTVLFTSFLGGFISDENYF